MDVTGKSGKAYQFPDDASDEEIHQTLGDDSPKTVVRQHLRTLPTKKEPGLLEQVGEAITGHGPGAEALGNAVIDALPGAGGLAGGIVGGLAGATTAPVTGPLGAIAVGAAGATAGGSLGTSIQQAIRTAQGRGPESGAAAVREAGQNALTQGGLQLGGEMLAPVAKLIGKPIMQWALRSSPEVAQTAIREGIQGTKAGLRKLMAKIYDAGDVAKAIAKRADARGMVHSPTGITKEIEQRVIPEIQDKIHFSDDAQTLYGLSDAFLKDHPGPITNQQLIKMRQDADQIVKPIRILLKQKKPIPADMLASSRWHLAFDDIVRDRLNSIEDPAVTQGLVAATRKNSMRLANQYTGELAETRNALEPIIRREGGFAKRLAGRSVGPVLGAAAGAAVPGDRAGHTLEGALLGTAATSPAFLALLAHGLSSPAVAEVLRQAPRGAAAALSQ